MADSQPVEAIGEVVRVPPNPSGLCECGCGQTTPIATRNDSWRNIRKGDHRRFVSKHGFGRPAEKRFWEKVKKGDVCWTWTGMKISKGYGYFWVDGVMQAAHRYSYELLAGPIPKGLELDHLCRNPACVNPDHLEPVTHRENSLRGESPAARNARKTHCKHGHPFSGANLYIHPTTGQRRCRACTAARNSRRFEEAKASA